PHPEPPALGSEAAKLMTRTVEEERSARPAESSACTATYRYFFGRVVELSKSTAGISACAASASGRGPAMTRQDATSVAPFQLAYTIVSSPVVLRLARTAGGVSGRPRQGKRKAR